MKRLESLTTKFILASALTMGSLALASTQADAAPAYLLSYYNFNSIGASPTFPLAPNSGTGSLTTTFSPADVSSASGTNKNRENTDPAGTALSLNSVGSSPFNNGNSLTLDLNTLSYTGLTFSLAIEGDAAGMGFTSDQLSYSVNGGTTFKTFDTAYTPPSTTPLSYDVKSFNLPKAADNKADVQLRITFNGATGVGFNRIDNLKVTADAPAPSSLLAVALGVPGIGLALRRRTVK